MSLLVVDARKSLLPRLRQVVRNSLKAIATSWRPLVSRLLAVSARRRSLPRLPTSPRSSLRYAASLFHILSWSSAPCIFVLLLLLLQSERDELESLRVETAKKQREAILAAKGNAGGRELTQVPPALIYHLVSKNIEPFLIFIRRSATKLRALVSRLLVVAAKRSLLPRPRVLVSSPRSSPLLFRCHLS